MKIEDILNVLHLTMILGMFSTGLYIYFNPVLWYDFIYAIVVFLLTATSIYLYQKSEWRNSSETEPTR